MNLTVSQDLQTLIYVIFKILYKKLCEHLEDQHNSVDQNYLNNQCMIQNYAWVREPFKVHDKPVDFNIKEYEKMHQCGSESTL